MLESSWNKPNKNGPEDTRSVIDKHLLQFIEIRTSRLNEFYEKNAENKLSTDELNELNTLIEDSLNVFLPRLDNERLKQQHDEFVVTIKKVDVLLAKRMADVMNIMVGNYNIMTKETERYSEDEIIAWKYTMGVVETKIVPRLKKEGLKEESKELESAVMALKIRIAYDDESQDPKVKEEVL